jgi:hypothetical protein
MSLLTRVALGAVLLGTLAVGVAGIQRSLWLDEAWVANSVRGEGEWLQTSPPLFLLAARASVAVFGLTTPALRAVPLAFALLAVGAAFLAVRRVAGDSWAVAGAGIVAFAAPMLEYLHSFKQYAGEVAASGAVLWAAAAYLQAPDRKRFQGLLGAVLLALPLAYSTAFVAPGAILAVALAGDRRRAGVLAGAAAAELAGLYWWFIAPNVSPALWTYWRQGAPGIGAWYVYLVVLVTAIRLILSLRRGQRTWVQWTQIATLTPCVLLFTAERAGWYPASARTRLFLYPCVLVLGATLLRRGAWARALPIAAIVLAIGRVLPFAAEPFEDYAAAVEYLRTHVAPGDRLLVHASAREGFRLYAAMAGWDAPALYGDTGWPCCRRAGNAPPRSSTPEAVYADLGRLVPEGFRGRVWLVYTTRPLHWTYTGLDEGNLWRSHMWARGCPPGEYVALPNLAISPMDCKPP